VRLVHALARATKFARIDPGSIHQELVESASLRITPSRIDFHVLVALASKTPGTAHPLKSRSILPSSFETHLPFPLEGCGRLKPQSQLGTALHCGLGEIVPLG
jgi:hypothetical protein